MPFTFPSPSVLVLLPSAFHRDRWFQLAWVFCFGTGKRGSSATAGTFDDLQRVGWDSFPQLSKFRCWKCEFSYQTSWKVEKTFWMLFVSSTWFCCKNVRNATSWLSNNVVLCSVCTWHLVMTEEVETTSGLFCPHRLDGRMRLTTPTENHLPAFAGVLGRTMILLVLDA